MTFERKLSHKAKRKFPDTTSQCPTEKRLIKALQLAYMERLMNRYNRRFKKEHAQQS